jgi:hypothetical protein
VDNELQSREAVIESETAGTIDAGGAQDADRDRMPRATFDSGYWRVDDWTPVPATA